MSETPMQPGGRYVVKHTTRTTRAVVDDAAAPHRRRHAAPRRGAPTRLELNDIGRVTLRTAAPLAFDPYRRNRATGSFILIDEATNDTVAAGHARSARRGRASARRTSSGTRAGSRASARWAALGARGATLWFTGLPASGKSTIAAALEARLVEAGIPAYRLDGDNLRHGLNADLGFSPEDRAENVRRTAHAARLLADAGVVALVSLVCPYAADRDAARARPRRGRASTFLEVFVDTPLEECERRDPKGLYARARAGEIPDFTGIAAPYEAPETPELRPRRADDVDAGGRARLGAARRARRRSSA